MVLKKLFKFFSAFKSSQFVSATDFVQGVLKGEDDDDAQINHALLDILEKEAFIEDIANEFVKAFNLRLLNRNNLKVFVYFILFIMDYKNADEILDKNIHYLKLLLYFLANESNYTLIAKIGSKYFDNEYIFDKIINPLKDRAKVIKSAKKELEQREANRLLKTKLTEPKEFIFHTKIRIPPPPSNTPAITSAFKFKKMGEKTEKRTTFEKEDVTTIFEKNYGKDNEKTKPHTKRISLSLQRLAEPKKDFTDYKGSFTSVIKPTKCPISKDVQIKSNVATTLREASYLLKSQEEEISKIDQIIKGGCNLQSLLELQNKERSDRQKQELEDIQRKHLQGLLTYEEAILARKKLVEENKAKALDLKNTKADMFRALEKWKEDEQLKLRRQVERSQELKENIKESEKRLQEDRTQQVKIQQYETKQLLKLAFKEKENELLRKVELIKEIKTMHEISTKLNAKKEFDPTESPNLGLLSEMSIAELQERLNWTKIKMQEELEEKQKRILNKKTEQQQMIEKLKHFIAETKLRPKQKPQSEPRLQMSPEILELKRLVEEKRSLRMKVS